MRDRARLPAAEAGWAELFPARVHLAAGRRAAEAELLGDCRATLGVGGGDERVGLFQIPAGAVVVGRSCRDAARSADGADRSDAAGLDAVLPSWRAWSYRFPARISRELLLRQENQPKPIRDIAWKGQVRLCARYRKLARTGKPANVVTTAIARELSGFVWAIARQVTVTAG